MTLKVGSIVICHGWDLVEGKKGFIEEIVSNPSIRGSGAIWSGKYSVYGLEEGNFSGMDKFYFGDFLGVNLEETKQTMTVDDLKKLPMKDPENKMLEQDIQIIIKNLGREMGKNEGRIDKLENYLKDG